MSLPDISPERQAFYDLVDQLDPPNPLRKIPEKALTTLPTLSGSACKTYIAILQHANSELTAFPSLARLAQLTNLSTSTLKRATSELAQANLLEVQHRPNHSSVFQL